MKIHKNGDVEFSLSEMESLMGGNTKICPDCGTVHPLPLWALKRNMFCSSCKDFTTKVNATHQDMG